MARPPRDTAAGIFHVFTHSVWAASLYRDDSDRAAFLRELARAGGKVGWTCLAFCLLPTHYHLILDVQDGALPAGMQSLNSRYAVGFNNRYGMKGHVHGRRYESRRVTGTDHLLTVFRYVVRNPVEALLCETAAAWRWSSYGGTIGASEPNSFVAAERILGCLADSRELAVTRLRTFVERS